MLGKENLDATLKDLANKKLDVAGDTLVTGENGTYFFEIKDANNQVAAWLKLNKGPFSVDLVKTTTNDLKKVVYVTDDKKNTEIFGQSFFNQTSATTSAVITTNGANNTNTKMTLTIAYDGMSGNSSFDVSSAEITLSIELGGPSRIDYWNLTAASIKLVTTVDTIPTSINLDLTPKFGYSSSIADIACATGYGVCAPLGLCWSCDDEVMRPNN